MATFAIQNYFNTTIYERASVHLFDVFEGFSILNNVYLQSAILLLVFFSIYKILSFLIEIPVEKFIKKHKEKIDRSMIKKIRRPIYYATLFIWLKLVVARLDLGFLVEDIISKSTNTILYIIFFYILYNTVDIFYKIWGLTIVKKTESSLDDELAPLLRKFSKSLVVTIALIAILSNWGVNVSGIIAGLGIAGLAIGLALKDSLANIFGGISLIFDQAFKVGDVIKLSNGDTGEVVDIGLRSTRIRNINNELLIIPNGVLGNATVMNFKLPDLSVRVVIPFCVKSGSDHLKAKKKVLEVLKTTDKKNIFLDDDKREPRVNLIELSSESIKFEAVFWIKNFDYKGAIKEKATSEIYSALKKNKFVFK